MMERKSGALINTDKRKYMEAKAAKKRDYQLDLLIERINKLERKISELEAKTHVSK